MTNLRLGEVICGLVTAKLIAGMPARVAQINAEKQDGLTIETPSDENYYAAGLTQIPTCPAIIISEGPSGFSDEGPHSLMVDTLVGVYCWDEDPDRQILAQRLQRLARAVIETVWDDQPQEQLDSLAFRIRPTRTIPGPVFEPDQPDTYRSFYIVEFAATALEG